jgi:hypothetical protein
MNNLHWTHGQLHQDMRAKGCEHLHAVFSYNPDAPNIKYTIAENVDENHAVAISLLPDICLGVADLERYLKAAMAKHEKKIVHEFNDGAYSALLEVFNQTHRLRTAAESARLELDI